MLQSHMGTCSMEPIYCDNKCGLKISRKAMLQHKASECHKRMVSCRHCAKDFTYDTLQVLPSPANLTFSAALVRLASWRMIHWLSGNIIS